jgi:hypothetical protein
LTRSTTDFFRKYKDHSNVGQLQTLPLLETFLDEDITMISANVQRNYRVFSRSLQLRRSVWQVTLIHRGLSESTKNLDVLSVTGAPSVQFKIDEKEKTKETSTNIKQEPQLVYESPLGNVVSKLRTVSLMTAIIGMTGVPCMIALKGGIPEGGILAAALLFVTGSVGSTAAIHFVFSPYVYRIEQIPIRQCSAEKSCDQSVDDLQGGNISESSSTSQKETLLKAWTRSLFLFNSSVVFDPCVDVKLYKGMRPMCNFVAKGQPLYVHPGTFCKSLHLQAKFDACPGIFAFDPHLNICLLLVLQNSCTTAS